MGMSEPSGNEQTRPGEGERERESLTHLRILEHVAEALRLARRRRELAIFHSTLMFVLADAVRKLAHLGLEARDELLALYVLLPREALLANRFLALLRELERERALQLGHPVARIGVNRGAQVDRRAALQRHVAVAQRQLDQLALEVRRAARGAREGDARRVCVLRREERDRALLAEEVEALCLVERPWNVRGWEPARVAAVRKAQLERHCRLGGQRPATRTRREGKDSLDAAIFKPSGRKDSLVLDFKMWILNSS